MNTFELLEKFADEYGMPQSSVVEFVDKIKDVKTLSELNELPKDFLTHHSYLNENIINKYEDMKIYDEKFEEKILEVDTNLMSGKDRDEFNKLLKVRELIINSKFGSVNWDW